MWTLLLSRLGDPPGKFLDRRQIDSGQIKIGRGAQTCDWVIADTSGQLSREHCTVSAVGLDLFVIDTSTNGVALNDPAQRIAPQMPVAIRVRDRLILGDYTIEVATEAAGLGAQLMPAEPAPAAAFDGAGGGFSQPDQWFDASRDAVWAIGQNDAEVHDFLGGAMHDFLGPAPSAAGSFGAGPDVGWGGPLSDAFSRPILAAAQPPALDAFAIPEDWAAPPAPRATPAAAAFPDPFAGPSPAAGGDDPFAGFAAAPGADDPFAGFGAPVADPFGAPLPDPAAGFAPPAAVPAPAPFGDGPIAPHIDPFADFAPPQSDPFAGFDIPDTAPVARTQFEPRPPADTSPDAAPPATPTPRAAPAPAPTGAGADAASWAAFCEGAGIDLADLRTSPDAMRRLGVLYRQVVLGLSDLIQDRAAFKNEFRVERTQLSFGRNNPLKHLAAVETAKLLLADPMPGFMAADDAVRSAFEDVKKHQMAMLAGVQHALTAVFERLSPGEIERVMAKAAGAKKGFAFSRGVNPWTVYQTVFEALRRDATSNVNSVMSVAFREGYEKFLGGQS
jgi:predicted component of type VI protein secretion system